MTQTPNTRPARKPIPQFSNYEEEAHFWDTHDVTDYFDDFQVAPVSLGTFLGHEIGIPISSEQMRVLSERARAEGTNEIELARRWIVERLAARDDEADDPPPSTR